jgi:hypothetical protein
MYRIATYEYSSPLDDSKCTSYGLYTVQSTDLAMHSCDYQRYSVCRCRNPSEGCITQRQQRNWLIISKLLFNFNLQFERLMRYHGPLLTRLPLHHGISTCRNVTHKTFEDSHRIHFKVTIIILFRDIYLYCYHNFGTHQKQIGEM